MYMCIYVGYIGYRELYVQALVWHKKSGLKTHWSCQYFPQIAISTALCSQIFLSAWVLRPPWPNPASAVHNHFLLLRCFTQVGLLAVLHSTIFILARAAVYDCSCGSLQKEPWLRRHMGAEIHSLLLSKEWGVAGSSDCLEESVPFSNFLKDTAPLYLLHVFAHALISLSLWYLIGLHLTIKDKSSTY